MILLSNLQYQAVEGRTYTISYLGLLGEKFFFVRLVCLGPSEEAVVNALQLYLADIDSGGGTNDVGLIDAAERDAVDLVGTSDEEQARIQLLQENDTLAPELSGEEDEHGAGHDGIAQPGGLVPVLPGGNGPWEILSKAIDTGEPTQ